MSGLPPGSDQIADVPDRRLRATSDRGRKGMPALLCDGIRRQFVALKQARNFVTWHGFAK